LDDGKKSDWAKKVASKDDYSTYVVRNGDTIYSVARKFGISPKALMALNGFRKEGELVPGQRLKVEIRKKAVEATAEVCAECESKSPALIALPADEPKKAENKKVTVYAVQSGDSLTKVARMHGTTVRGLKDANNLTSDFLSVGQKLNVPTDDVSTSAKDSKKGGRSLNKVAKGELDGDGKYIVVEGDSLCVIAKRFDVKCVDLQRANGIDDPSKLRIGQKLVIPSQTAAVSADAAANSGNGGQKSFSSTSRGNVGKRPVSSAKTTSSGSQAGSMYTIKGGDTIEGVARDLGVSREDLMATNSLSRDTALQAGKKLLIPDKKVVDDVKRDIVGTSVSTDENFFDNFEEISVVEVNN
jgi:LysM repeat protein